MDPKRKSLNSAPTLMVSTMWTEQMANLRTTGRLSVLAVVLIAVAMAASPLAFWLSGFGGLLACALSAVFIWFASAVASALGHFAHGPNQALTSLLISMLVRMAIPLVACMVALASGSQLVGSGFVFYVLGFYLIALPIDTIFAVVSSPKTHLSSRS
jgi:hypothetical protein